ncbi:MAG TPA: DoxX family protein [Burkholderiales bacterium]|nr:DoxX family protein [Burkholderiales bacterium]
MREPLLAFAGKWLIVAFFIVAGVSNLTKARIADHIGRMAGFGMPFPATAFWIGIAMEFTGCALIIAEWHAAAGVVLLMVFTIAATAIFHRFWEKSDPLSRNISRLTLLGNLAILGGLCLLLQNILNK